MAFLFKQIRDQKDLVGDLFGINFNLCNNFIIRFSEKNSF